MGHRRVARRARDAGDLGRPSAARSFVRGRRHGGRPRLLEQGTGPRVRRAAGLPPRAADRRPTVARGDAPRPRRRCASRARRFPPFSSPSSRPGRRVGSGRTGQRVSVVVFALLFATPLFAYGLLLFSHALVAAALFGAWASLFTPGAPRAAARRDVLAGALLGVAVLAEYPAAVPAAFSRLRPRGNGERDASRGSPRGAHLSLWPSSPTTGSASAAFSSSRRPSRLSASFRALASTGLFGIGLPSPVALGRLVADPSKGLLVFSPFLVLGLRAFPAARPVPGPSGDRSARPRAPFDADPLRGLPELARRVHRRTAVPRRRVALPRLPARVSGWRASGGRPARRVRGSRLADDARLPVRPRRIRAAVGLLRRTSPLGRPRGRRISCISRRAASRPSPCRSPPSEPRRASSSGGAVSLPPPSARCSGSAPGWPSHLSRHPVPASDSSGRTWRTSTSGSAGRSSEEIAATGSAQPRLLARREVEESAGPTPWPF